MEYHSAEIDVKLVCALLWKPSEMSKPPLIDANLLHNCTFESHKRTIFSNNQHFVHNVSILHVCIQTTHIDIKAVLEKKARSTIIDNFGMALIESKVYIVSSTIHDEPTSLQWVESELLGM